LRSILAGKHWTSLLSTELERFSLGVLPFKHLEVSANLKMVRKTRGTCVHVFDVLMSIVHYTEETVCLLTD